MFLPAFKVLFFFFFFFLNLNIYTSFSRYIFFGKILNFWIIFFGGFYPLSKLCVFFNRNIYQF